MRLSTAIPQKPACIMIAGQPGAGKTTLARLLGERLHLPVLSRDGLKEGYVTTVGAPHAQLPPEANAHVSRLFFELVERYLAGSVSLIIEAAFQHRVWEGQLPKLAALARPCVIVCTVEPTLAAERHLLRGLADPTREFFHGDETVAQYRESGIIAPLPEYIAPTLDLPTLAVATEAGYNPTLDTVLGWIGEQTKTR